MTDLLARDPNDTGEIPGDSTRNLKPKIRQALLHVSPNLRSADATEVIPLAEEPLFVQLHPGLATDIFALDDRPYPPVPPPPPPAPGRHAWNQAAADWPAVRRAVPDLVDVDWRRPPQHRAPRRYRLSVAVGSVLLFGAVALLGVLAVIR